MNRLPTALLSVLVALSALVEPTTSAQSEAVSYSREATFSTIRLPYSSLYNLISRIRQLLATANAMADRRYEEESLRLQGAASSAGVELPKGFELRDFSAAPNTSYDIFYQYRNSRSPISGIDIRFSDYGRQITVTGTSREQVDALTEFLIRDLEQAEFAFGGFGHRLVGGFVLLLVGVHLTLIGLTPALTGFFRWFSVTAGLGILLSLLVLPWSSLFPGAIAFPGEASILVRQAPLISFLGLVATLLTFIAGIAYTAYITNRRRVGADKDADERPNSTLEPAARPGKKKRRGSA